MPEHFTERAAGQVFCTVPRQCVKSPSFVIFFFLLFIHAYAERQRLQQVVEAMLETVGGKGGNPSRTEWLGTSMADFCPMNCLPYQIAATREGFLSLEHSVPCM